MTYPFEYGLLGQVVVRTPDGELATLTVTRIWRADRDWYWLRCGAFRVEVADVEAERLGELLTR